MDQTWLDDRGRRPSRGNAEKSELRLSPSDLDRENAISAVYGPNCTKLASMVELDTLNTLTSRNPSPGSRRLIWSDLCCLWAESHQTRHDARSRRDQHVDTKNSPIGPRAAEIRPYQGRARRALAHPSRSVFLGCLTAESHQTRHDARSRRDQHVDTKISQIGLGVAEIRPKHGPLPLPLGA